MHWQSGSCPSSVITRDGRQTIGHAAMAGRARRSRTESLISLTGISAHTLIPYSLSYTLSFCETSAILFSGRLCSVVGNSGNMSVAVFCIAQSAAIRSTALAFRVFRRCGPQGCFILLFPNLAMYLSISIIALLRYSGYPSAVETSMLGKIGTIERSLPYCCPLLHN